MDNPMIATQKCTECGGPIYDDQATKLNNHLDLIHIVCPSSKNEAIPLTKEFRIQILNPHTANDLIMALIYNGYSVTLHQDKKSLRVKLANYYFKD